MKNKAYFPEFSSLAVDGQTDYISFIRKQDTDGKWYECAVRTSHPTPASPEEKEKAEADFLKFAYRLFCTVEVTKQFWKLDENQISEKERICQIT